MLAALRNQFKKLVRQGSLLVSAPDGDTWTFGDGTGPEIHIALRDSHAARTILIDPDLALGERYMDGGLTIVSGTLHDYLALLFANMQHTERLPVTVTLPYALRIATRRLRQRNAIDRSRRNAAHHYDLSGHLYELFLDRERNYSCAYFDSADATLEQAQLAKMRHIAAKLAIEPGMKVLDIGCGWGGLALYLSEVCGADVVGITLSEEQFQYARDRAAARLNRHTVFRLVDYREVEGVFDRIVSVGMFEHVGIAHFGEYFAQLKRLLKPDGVALVHSICRLNGPGATSAWTERYIFPGGYIPALSEVVPHVEHQGLVTTDVEILRLHYAETLKHWRERFAHNRHRARALYDERFCRMWEFYLSSSECAFRYGALANMQIQLVRDQNVLPLTRRYMEDEEHRLRGIDSRRRHLRAVKQS